MFLRCAGLNAFAAQVVLNDLKAGGAGLPDFVLASPTKRLCQFRDRLGGQRALRHTDKAIEEPWILAGH